MIATVTLNPAVDKTLSTSRVILGAVNRMDQVKNIAGGKGINVAKVLRQYDYPVKTLGFLGGYSGQVISDAVQAMGAEDAFTKVSGETRTSINVLSEDGYVTEFLEPGPQISDDELASFFEEFPKYIEDCDIVVISGSAPMGIGADIYVKMINIANELGKKVLLDTSGDNLKKGIYARPFMVKPNIKELESIMGKKIIGMQEVCEAASMIVEWGVPNVLVSMGNKGILYAKAGAEDTELYYMMAPRIRMVNSVGSGDSAVAAFAMGIEEKLSPEDILRKCVAISAANACSIENGVIPKEKAVEFEEQLSLSTPIF